ncbi:RxLR effector protein Avr3a [Datura stramonium]|uniref:U-box domain-containing protein n=1 Tax=Datura stramonium TaxID=4076 RepID=A0ABS8VA58_DATST|nr:RxLR effector protein Avr3a [Datura stramonium]
MVFSWRRRKDRRVGKEKLSRLNSCKEVRIPQHFLCPISLDLMKDPVTLCSGITYDRDNIEKWMEEGNATCPVTNIQALKSTDVMIPNHAIRKMIQDWCVENRNYGIERVPTPRIPVTSSQVTEICSRLTVEAERGNGEKCTELVGRVRILAKESERNKKCIVECGTGSVFAACFEIFSNVSVGIWEELSKDLLSALTWMFPIGEEGISRLVSSTSLRCMARFLKGEDLSARQNAVIVMKELLYCHQTCANVLTQIQDLAQSLYQMVKVPICPSATKASLMVIHSIICVNDKNIVSKFVNMGLVSLVLEILVDCEKGITEKALAVLDRICNFEQGKEKAYEHGLTIAIIAKKIIRVSEMATECSISVLWKLLVCKSGNDHENSVIEALELGAFQKLLVVLQVGCGENTKEKVTELLKLMNLYKDKVDCFDGSTFKINYTSFIIKAENNPSQPNENNEKPKSQQAAAAAAATTSSTTATAAKPKKPVYSMKKGQIVRVDKEKYLNSINIGWIGIPTAPAWLPTEMLIKSDKLDYERI